MKFLSFGICLTAILLLLLVNPLLAIAAGIVLIFFYKQSRVNSSVPIALPRVKQAKLNGPKVEAKQEMVKTEMPKRHLTLVHNSNPVQEKLDIGPDISPRSMPSSLAKVYWAGKGSSIEISGLTLRDPMIYWSFSRESAAYAEPSCVTLNTNIKRPSAPNYEPMVVRYSHNLSFAHFPPNSRWDYLSWLSSGRTAEPSGTDSYAHLYFYGLERHLLVDKIDIDAVLQEAFRLFKQFQGWHVQSKIGTLISFVIAREVLSNNRFDYLSYLAEFPYWLRTEYTRSTILLPFLDNQNLVDTESAYIIASNCRQSANSVVIERVNSHFKRLFAIRFEKQFKSGIKLNLLTPKNNFTVRYLPSNPHLHDLYRSTELSIPELHLNGRIERELSELWNNCVEDLKPLSRAVLKGIDVNSGQAHKYLPPDLQLELQHPDQMVWESLISEYSTTPDISVIPVYRLAELHNLTHQKRLSLNQSTDLSNDALSIGLAIIPDAKTSRSGYDWDSYVSLIRCSHTQYLLSDDHYPMAMLVLELGVALAACDGTIVSEEIEHIQSFIKSQFSLNEFSLRKLEAYLYVLKLSPPSIVSTLRYLKSRCTRTQINLILPFLVGVADANGVIHAEEVSLLNKVCKSLEIKSDKLDKLLLNIPSNGLQPVEVQTAKTRRRGELIPTRAAAPEAPPIELNEEYLKQVLSDTSEVAAMLNSILSDTESDNHSPEDTSSIVKQKTAPHEISTSLQSTVLSLLDNKYHSAVSELLLLEQWSKLEFQELSRKHGLMPANFLDSVNMWSDEHLGDFLIEEGSSFRINKSLLEGKL